MNNICHYNPRRAWRESLLEAAAAVGIKSPPWWPQKHVWTNRPIHTHGHINKSHVRIRPGLSLKYWQQSCHSQWLTAAAVQTHRPLHLHAVTSFIQLPPPSLLVRTSIPSCRVLLHPYAYSNYSLKKTAFTTRFLNNLYKRINKSIKLHFLEHLETNKKHLG